MEQEFLLYLFQERPQLWQYYSKVVTEYICWKLKRMENENDKDNQKGFETGKILD